MEVYGEYLFKLFPCWLLSPENVSTILPLKRNLFDVVLFDEASQVFIENTIPSIYRGNRIVVAGDAKQLRPTTTFMKRYMGADVEDDLDYTTQAALEVESLLDLAVSRYASSNITYHYRSKNEELIDFSNKAFYSGTLQIAPNVSKNVKHKPIERIMVNGTWRDRRNVEEAKRVVDLIKHILKTRKNKETIGVITFNVEQENCIEELIDKKCFDDIEFRNLYLKERNRIEDGEDVSLFVKNLENVQGDERDIIIFSIGYAKNEFGKVNATFGSLSNEGGENRLNVAITRAKQKIYVVTSIEPEELKVDASKHVGPKLLRSYLTYTRAVSNGNSEEVKTILNSFGETSAEKPKLSNLLPLEKQIATKLEKLGYKTDLNLGNSNSKISIAIYDKKKDKYLLGIETDEEVTQSSTSVLERDVFRNEFLKSKGWKVIRVWSRDWWHNPNQVINTIVK
ncbi:MAG: HRDC domain protein, partial [Clostridia bacterium]|nr:HRDC domain protein [Clostridia bacterium]